MSGTMIAYKCSRGASFVKNFFRGVGGGGSISNWEEKWLYLNHIFRKLNYEVEDWSRVVELKRRVFHVFRWACYRLTVCFTRPRFVKTRCTELVCKGLGESRTENRQVLIQLSIKSNYQVTADFYGSFLNQCSHRISIGTRDVLAICAR